MDSLTQIVLGAAVGELVLGKKLGNKALLWGAVAGTIPDLDVLSRIVFDDLGANEFHRGITHSILFSLVMAPVLGYWVRWHRASLLGLFMALVGLVLLNGADHVGTKASIGLITSVIIGLILWKTKNANDATVKEWSWLFGWTLITHPLLDCHTTWGTQLFWPLPWKVSYNNIFVVDPAYTVPFLICVGIVLFLERNDPRRRWMNAIGIGISTAYMVLTIVFKMVANHEITASLQRQGITYNSFTTRPTPFNSILWAANVDCNDHYLLGYHSLLDQKPEVDLINIPKNHALLGPWAEHEKVHRLIRLSQGNYIIQSRNDTLVFCDLRFGQLGPPGAEKPFVYSYQLIPEGTDLRVELLPPPRPKGNGMKVLIGELWTRIKGE